MPRLPRLRDVRERFAVTQQELASKSGVAKSTIIDIELGRTQARIPTVRKLAEALGVEPAALIEE